MEEVIAILSETSTEIVALQPQASVTVTLYTPAAREPISYVGINSVGLRRRGFTDKKINEIQSIQPMDLLTETMFRELSDRANGVFIAQMGAEAIQSLLEKINLDDLSVNLRNTIRDASGQRRLRAIKRLRVVESFRKGGSKPEWMILNVLPVLPPDLHPMVQLDGGRFATSDLNDLYRRVINRNNRLKHLIELQAPNIIIRNEKRMLQESVDALIDNGRRGRAISGSHNHKLKSLTDLLRGK